jgi:hypothetical protein
MDQCWEPLPGQTRWWKLSGCSASPLDNLVAHVLVNGSTHSLCLHKTPGWCSEHIWKTYILNLFPMEQCSLLKVLGTDEHMGNISLSLSWTHTSTQEPMPEQYSEGWSEVFTVVTMKSIIFSDVKLSSLLKSMEVFPKQWWTSTYLFSYFHLPFDSFRCYVRIDKTLHKGEWCINRMITYAQSGEN